jgi:hypothetical protein
MSENETAPNETAPKAPRAPKAPKAPKNSGAPPKAPPLLKLSARQRSNVDALDNGASTSASVINHVLACAGRPLSVSELTALSVSAAPDKFTKETAHGRVSNHVRHLLKRRLIENVGGAWRLVGAIGAAKKALNETAPKRLVGIVKKAPRGAPANETNETNENETAPE